MADDYKALLREEQQDDVAGAGYRTLLEEDQEVRTRASLQLAADKDPKVQAKVIDLSTRTGLPPEAIERDIPSIEGKVLHARYSDLLKRAPTTSRTLADPIFAGVAHDDIERLAALEEILRSPKTQMGYLEELGARWAQGNATIKASDIGMQRWRNIMLGDGVDVNAETLAELAELEKGLAPIPAQERPFLASFPLASAQQLPILWRLGASAAEGALTYGLTGAGMAALAGQIPPLTGTPEEAITMPIAFAVMAPIGGKISAYEAAFNLEAGLAINEFLGFEDNEGNRIDPKLAGYAATASGAINAYVEFLSLKFLGKTFSGFKPLVRRKIAAVLKTEAGREIVKRIAGNYLVAVGAEGAEEVIQSYVNQIFGEVIKTVDPDAFTEQDWEKALDEVFSAEQFKQAVAEGAEGLKATVLIGMPGTVVSAATANWKAATGTAAEQEKIGKLIEVAKESNLQTNSPETFQQLIREIEEDTATFEEIYITWDKIAQFMEAEGIDMGEAQDNPVIQTMIDQLGEAEATTGEVIIPVADYVAHISQMDNAEILRPHIKLSAGSRTISEEGEADQAIRARIKGLMEKAAENADIHREAHEIYAEVESQLVETGVVTKENAGVMAQIIPAYVSTKVARLRARGIEIKTGDIRQMMGLKIIGPLAPEIEGGTVITQGLPDAEAALAEFQALETAPANIEAREASLSAVTALSDKHQVPVSVVAAEDSREIFRQQGFTEDELGVLTYRPKPRTLAQGPRNIQGELMEGLRRDRNELNEQGTATMEQIFAINRLFQGVGMARVGEVGPMPEIDINDDEALTRRLSELLFTGILDRNADLHIQPGDESTIHRGTESATPDRLFEQVRLLQEQEKVLQRSMDEFTRKQLILDERVGVVMNAAQRTLAQDENRAEVTFFEDTQESIIRLKKSTDLSSFLHESGHIFLRMEQRLFNDPNIPAEAKADSQTTLDWLGAENFDNLTVEQEEQFAQGFETYLFEGKAPSVELRSAFRRFAAWLKEIYKSLRNMNVQLTPEIRGVMDRMLATDDQIAEANAEQFYDPLFESEEDALEMGMTASEYAKYREDQEKAPDSAEEILRTRLLKELRRKATKEWNAERATVKDSTREEIEAQPLYRAIAFMFSKTVPEGFEENKLDRKTVYRMLGLLPPKKIKYKDVIDVTTDSLLIAIAKKGGIDRDSAVEHAGQAISENWQGANARRAPNQSIVGKPVFRAKDGMSFSEMAKVMFDAGYIEANDSNELLDLIMDELAGSPTYHLGVDPSLVYDIPEEFTEADVKPRMKQPPQLRGLTKAGAAAPDTIAQIFGFASGHELVMQIVNSPTLEVAVNSAADRVMVERHGDTLNDGSLEQQAMEAAHNTDRGNVILRELKALTRKTNTAAIAERRQIRGAAEAIIAGKKITALRPDAFRRAEIKAAHEAATAKQAGDVDAALKAKQRQYLNFHLWRAAVSAREQAEKIRVRMKQMQAKKYSDRQVNPEYITRFKQLLTAYDFRKSNKAAREAAQASLESVAAWAKRHNESTDSPSQIIDSPLLQQVTHYRDMTLDELIAVRDIATSILHAGRSESAVAREAWNAEMAAISVHIDDNTKPTKVAGPEETFITSGATGFKQFLAAHRKYESLIRQADGFFDLGPLWKRAVKPLVDANRASVEMHEVAHETLDNIFKGHEGVFNWARGRTTFTLDSGEKITLSLGGRITVALNWGNVGNREALLNMTARPMTENDVNTILATLTDKNWDLVESIWEYVDSFWSQIAELEKSFTGVAPKKVEALPFTTPHGRDVRGGYYPLQADTRISARAREHAIEERAERLLTEGAARAQTQHGFTIERTRFAGQHVKLSIETLFIHIDEVIHDLSHRRAVREADAVLRHKQVKASVIQAVGLDAERAIKRRLTEVAAGHFRPSELAVGERIARFSRLALTYWALGFSLKTMFAQMLGLGVAIGEFGLGTTTKGIVGFYSNPIENGRFIKEHSVFMRDRISTMNRDTGTILRNWIGPA